jgi:hypothetical protein
LTPQIIVLVWSLVSNDVQPAETTPYLGVSGHAHWRILPLIQFEFILLLNLSIRPNIVQSLK